MSTLSRYIAKLYLTNALVLLLILSLLVLLADFSTRFDEYARWGREIASAASAPVSPGSLSTIWHTSHLLADVWTPRLLVLCVYLLGPVMVGALGFTCAHLVKHRELVAVLAGGCSLWRVARPMLASAVLLVLGQLVLREVIIPRYATLLPRSEREAAAHRIAAMDPTRAARTPGWSDFVLDAQGRLIYVRDVQPEAGRVRGLLVIERDDVGLMRQRITARSAQWRDGAWHLEDGLATQRPRMTEGAGGEIRAGQRLDQRALDRLETDIDPTMLRLRRNEGLASHLSSRQLSAVIKRYRSQEQAPHIARRIESLERTRLARFVGSACLLLTLVSCLPFFLRKEPVNMLRQSLLATPLAAGGIAASVLGVMLPLPGLPVWLGVMLPALLLLPGAVAASASVRS